MAEFFDSDTYLGGFKRRMSEHPEIESTQPSLEEQHSNSLSPEQHPPDIHPPAKVERETESGLLKKARCSSSDESHPNVIVIEKQEAENQELKCCEMGFSGTQELTDSEVGFSEVRDLKNCEMGFSGNQELKNCEMSFSGSQELKNGDMGSSGNQELTSLDAGLSEIRELGICQMGFSGNEELSSRLSAEDGQEHFVVEDRTKVLATSCVSFDENGSEISLKNKQDECLVESVTRVYNFTDFQSKRQIVGKGLDNSSWVVDENIGTVKIMDIDGKGNFCGSETGKCAMKIEVIDDIAVIETTSACEAGNGEGKEKGLMGRAEHSERNVHENFVNQERDGKKEKRSRRRGKGSKKLLGTNGKENILIHKAGIPNGCGKKVDDAKKAYSRQEMEALRFANLEAQQKKWIEVYCGLVPDVAREFDGLIDSNNQKHISIDFDPRQQFGKPEKKIPGVLGDDSSQKIDNENKIMNPVDPAFDLSVGVEGECSDEDDSDEEYTSIQRPAFLVTGEPNFDSGPPQDGLEYLRRVRWEAAQVPKVKVAKLERSKLKKEQTAYMPKIPDIEKCPELLLPLKHWEDAFIADFSELRLALSRLEVSSSKIPAKLHVSSSIHQERGSNQLPETLIVEKFDKLTTDGDESNDVLHCSMPENNASPVSPENSVPKSSASGSSSGDPTLSAVLGMDSVARLSMLRKRIKSAENTCALSRNDCAWLYALCAAIDAPLDADTAAALRCLLRKCASLRAVKSELDDEVVMLNILATITGKYFGQSEF